MTDVRIAGMPGFPEPDLRRRLRLTQGDRFGFAAWQRDRDRLEELYHSRGFYEARIRARRLPDAADGVVLEYGIERGPETRLDVRGAALPEEVRARIIERWSSALFDAFLERDATTLVRDHLARGGHLHATIAATVRPEADGAVKTLNVVVDPGPMLPSRIEFAGNAGIPATRLHEAAHAVGTLAAWIDPPSFARAMQSVYRDEGFLAAQVEVAPPEISQGTSVVRVEVREGAPFLVGAVGLRDADALPERELREALGISPGMPTAPPISPTPWAGSTAGFGRPASLRPAPPWTPPSASPPRGWICGSPWTPGRGPSCGTSSSRAAMRASRSWRGPSR